MGLCSIAAPRGPPAGTALTPNPSRGPSCPQVSLRAGTLRAFPRTRGRGDARPAHPLLQPHGAARLVGTGGAETRGGRGAVPAARRDRDPPPEHTGTACLEPAVPEQRGAEPGMGGCSRCGSSVPWGRGCGETHRTPHPTASPPSSPPSRQPATCECESWLRRAAELRFVVALGSAVLAVPIRAVFPDPPPSPLPPRAAFVALRGSAAAQRPHAAGWGRVPPCAPPPN